MLLKINSIFQDGGLNYENSKIFTGTRLMPLALLRAGGVPQT